MPPRYLHRKLLDWIPGQTPGKTVELGRFDVVAVLVRLAPPKRRGFQFPRVDYDADGHDSESDVCGIKPVMRDRRFGDVHPARAMHESRRAERGFTGQSGIY